MIVATEVSFMLLSEELSNSIWHGIEKYQENGNNQLGNC